MKKIIPFLLVAIACIGCNSNKTKTANDEPQSKDTTIIAGVYHFQFDNFELWTLQDKQNSMPASLFPNVDKKILKETMPNGEAESSINGFLIKKDGQYILFDTGLGLDNGGVLLDKLIMLNIKPEDITNICITHCHRDHIGGLLTKGKVAFPNADVYFADKELKSFRNDEATQAVLGAYGDRIRRFTAGDTLLKDIKTIDASGHTPGHTLYEIGNLLIVGDLIHAAALQIPYPEACAKYDQDPKKAAATRKKIYQYIRDNNRTVAGMHMPYAAVVENFGSLTGTFTAQ